MYCIVHFIITLFNVGNVLLCVIYQLNFTVFMYVKRISRYVMLYIAFGIIAVSRNCSRSWNALPVDKVVRLCVCVYIYIYIYIYVMLLVTSGFFRLTTKLWGAMSNLFVRCDARSSGRKISPISVFNVVIRNLTTTEIQWTKGVDPHSRRGTFCQPPHHSVWVKWGCEFVIDCVLVASTE